MPSQHTKSFSLLLILLAALAGTFALARPARAQPEPPDLARYEQLLREGQAAASRGDLISLQLLTPELTVAEVRLPDGQLAAVDNRWLSDELSREAPRLDVVAARLGALVEALNTATATAPADGQARLDEILSRPPFGSEAPSEPGWLEQFFAWLDEQLARIDPPAGQAAAGTPSTWGAWVLAALGAVLVLAVIVLWVRGLRRALQPDTSLPAAVPEAHDEADARSQATALARAGDYRGAVRLLALGALLWLDDRGQLRYDANQTNREHLARLRDRPGLRGRLAPVVDTADRVWYGGQPLDSTGYAAFEREVDELKERGGDEA